MAAKTRMTGGTNQTNPAGRKGIIMVYNFVGEALTLADLEKAAIKETRKPLSDSAKKSWDYFGFDREDEWKAVMTDTGGILITEESQDLNMANIYPNIDSFILWLEETCEERQIKTKE